ncbi:MAG: hypothetical protein R3E95_00500 [Thiolinea sp.]
MSALITDLLLAGNRCLFSFSWGEIRISSRATSEADKHRADKTIRVFNLDSPVLTGARAAAVSKYKKKILDDLDEIASWNNDEREEFLRAEIEATKWMPFATTIKHFLKAKFNDNPRQ